MSKESLVIALAKESTQFLSMPTQGVWNKYRKHIADLVKLAEIQQQKLNEILRWHRNNKGLDDCADECGECSLCSILDCPWGDSMHWHHDGCPSCYDPKTDAETNKP